MTTPTSRQAALEAIGEILHATQTKNCLTSHALKDCVHRDPIRQWAKAILAAVEHAAPEEAFNPRDEDVAQLLRLHEGLEDARAAIREIAQTREHEGYHVPGHIWGQRPAGNLHCEKCDPWLALPAVVAAMKEEK